MLKTNFIFFLTILTTTLFLLSQPTGSAQAQTTLTPLIDSGPTGLTLTWVLPGYSLTSAEVEGVIYSHLQMNGLSSGGGPGQPELPSYSKLLGLPSTGQAVLHILEIQQETISLPYPPLPASEPIPLSATDLAPEALVNGGLTQRLPDPTIYQTNAFYPAEIAHLSQAQSIRDRRLATLTINPLRVNPATQTLEIITYLKLEVIFTDAAPLMGARQAQPSDGFSQALDSVLLNPEASQWPAARPDSNTLTAPAAITGNELKVLATDPGLYVLTYSDLQSAGLPVTTLDPRTFKLKHGYPRQELAVIVEGQTDGVFNPGDRLLFYAQPTFSRFVNYDIYFLSYGGATGLRMTSRSGNPTGPAGIARYTVTAESNKFYDPLYAGRDGDRWYWAKLATPNSPSGSYAISLDRTPLGSGPAATLTLWLQGYTASSSQNPDHKVNLVVNGTFVGTVSWDGKSAYTASVSVPTTLLRVGMNQIQVSLPGLPGVFAEGMWLDAIQLRYPINQTGGQPLHFRGETGKKSYTIGGWSGGLLAFEVTNPWQPQQISGYGLSGGTLTIGDATTAQADYFIGPTNQLKTPLALQSSKTLTDPVGGADYIIISPASLAGALTPLLNHRANQGLRVAIFQTEAIYDAYGAGRMDSEAIKNFLAHAYATWTAPAPLYVLLVGDGSYDFKNYSGYNPLTLLPPHLVAVDPWWGETASDNRLVTFSGGDSLPGMLIGRLPVNSVAETSVVVNKIIGYETNPPPGSWQSTSLFVTDNPDGAGNFYTDADESYQALVGGLHGQRFYFSPTPNNQPHFYSNIDTLRANFINSFNQGSSLVTFHGHSSWHQWAAESILHLNDLGQLNNQNRLPVILEMTCFTGFFHHPEYPTLDESLLRRAEGGAVAVWAGTGLGVGTGHRKLQEGFNQALMRQGETNLGAATLAGKLELYAAGYYQDLIDTYVLLGDPAMNLASVLKPDVSIRQQLVTQTAKPGDTVEFNIIVQNIGVGTASAITVTSLLPPTLLSPSWSASDPRITAGSGTYRWNLPDLTPAESVELTISATIDPTLPDDFAILNKADVATGVAELSTLNNSSTLIIGGYRTYFPIIKR